MKIDGPGWTSSNLEVTNALLLLRWRDRMGRTLKITGTAPQEVSYVLT
jgi:hypothetical protein